MRITSAMNQPASGRVMFEEGREFPATSTWSCRDCPAQLNKTISLADLREPAAAAAAQRLTRFARQLWWNRIPFAVNGVLRMRWRRLHWNKLWEYARGLAYGDFKPGMRVLDFGGGSTIPVFHLASRGADVLSLDIDPVLTDHANAVARRMRWTLQGSTFDMAGREPTPNWGLFDRVISYCVIEHIDKRRQLETLARLAALLKSGGLLELTFDFGEEAPVSGAIRSTAEVQEMIGVTGLTPQGDGAFHDTHERYVIDKKYPDRHFTFGSLFLRKP
jgi:hypothetical protein